MNAARAEHVADVIAPALAAGRWVVTDRFTTATLAYQGFGRGLARERLQAIGAFAAGGCEPHIVLLVDIPVELSMSRVAARAAAAGVGEDRLERENAAFHERVRAGYLALAREDPRIHVIDGTQPVEDVVAEAWRIVSTVPEPA